MKNCRLFLNLNFAFICFLEIPWMRSPLEQFDIKTFKTVFISIVDFDLSFQNILIPVVCMNLILLILGLVFKFNMHIIPSYFQLFFIQIYKFIITLIKQQIGHYGLLWFPILFTVFNFVFLGNMLGLLPFGLALTSQFILIFWLSCTICTAIFLIGLLRFHLKFLHIFIPQSPLLLLPLLMIIEIFSYLIRFLSLALRLAANIIAGHTLVHILINFFFKIFKIDLLLCLIVLIPIFLILILEFGVAFLQAYVFTVLFCIYLSDTQKGMAH